MMMGQPQMMCLEAINDCPGLWVCDVGGERERDVGLLLMKALVFGEEGGDSCCEVGWQLKGRVGSTMSVLAFMCWNQ